MRADNIILHPLAVKIDMGIPTFCQTRVTLGWHSWVVEGYYTIVKVGKKSQLMFQTITWQCNMIPVSLESNTCVNLFLRGTNLQLQICLLWNKMKTWKIWSIYGGGGVTDFCQFTNFAPRGPENFFESAGFAIGWSGYLKQLIFAPPWDFYWTLLSPDLEMNFKSIYSSSTTQIYAFSVTTFKGVPNHCSTNINSLGYHLDRCWLVPLILVAFLVVWWMAVVYVFRPRQRYHHRGVC